MKIARLFFLLLFLIACALPVLAEPPFVQTTGTNTGIYSLTIVYPNHLHFPQSSSIVLNFDVLDSNYSKVDNSSAYCNFYNTFSNGSLSIFDNLTYSPSLRNWYYNLNSSFTGELGYHSFYVWCNDYELNQSGFVSELYTITISGDEVQIGRAVSYSAILFILAVLFVMCVLITINIDGNNVYDGGGDIRVNYLKYAKTFMFFISYLLLTFLSFMAWQISLSVSIVSATNQIFRWIFLVLEVGTIPLFIGVSIFTITKLLLDLKIHKWTSRGLPPR